MTTENKYLNFEKQQRKKDAKTDSWLIRPKNDANTLGEIKWFPAWRKYCFFPNGYTIWDHNCLFTVMEFLQEQMEQRKEDRQNVDGQLSDDQIWTIIEEAAWSSDHDYERIQELFKKLSIDHFQQLEKFVNDRTSDLYKRFKDDWLGSPGINCSDDSWSDLIAEVVGRGKGFYSTISAEMLREMADTNDYQESFIYSF